MKSMILAMTALCLSVSSINVVRAEFDPYDDDYSDHSVDYQDYPVEDGEDDSSVWESQRQEIEDNEDEDEGTDVDEDDDNDNEE